MFPASLMITATVIPQNASVLAIGPAAAFLGMALAALVTLLVLGSRAERRAADAERRMARMEPVLSLYPFLAPPDQEAA